MSLDIRHPLQGEPVFPNHVALRSAAGSEAKPPRLARPLSVFGPIFGPQPPAPSQAPSRIRAAVRDRRSLFHRWAAADLASRDLAFPLSLNPARR